MLSVKDSITSSEFFGIEKILQEINSLISENLQLRFDLYYTQVKLTRAENDIKILENHYVEKRVG